LLPPSRDGVRGESKEVGQNRISAAAELERFQSGVQAALPFIEQAEEQHDRSFHFVGRDLKFGSVRNGGNSLYAAPQQTLPLAVRRIVRGVEVQAGDAFAGDAFALGELPQNILRFHVQRLRQLFGEIALG